jgi:hypothetical protein
VSGAETLLRGRPLVYANVLKSSVYTRLVVPYHCKIANERDNGRLY